MGRIGSQWLNKPEQDEEDEPIVNDDESLTGTVMYFGKPKLKRGEYVRNLGLKLESGAEFLIRWEEAHTTEILRGQTLKSGDKIRVNGAKRLDFIPNFCDGMFVDPTTVNKIGVQTMEVAHSFTIDQIRFGDDWVRLDNGEAVAYFSAVNWKEKVGIPTKAFYNNVKDKLVEAEETFNIRVHAQYHVAYQFVEGSSDQVQILVAHDRDITLVSAQGLLVFEEYLTTYTNERRLEAFFRVLEAQAQNVWMMGREDIQSLIDREGIGDLVDVSQVHTTLMADMTQRNYDPQYFEFLRNNGTLEGVNDEGFFFKLKDDYYVFEIPVAGKASYVFKGDPIDIMARIREIQEANVPTEMVTREEIRMSNGNWKNPLIRMKAANPDELEWFVERAIHTENFVAWHGVISKYLER